MGRDKGCLVRAGEPLTLLFSEKQSSLEKTQCQGVSHLNPTGVLPQLLRTFLSLAVQADQKADTHLHQKYPQCFHMM